MNRRGHESDLVLSNGALVDFKVRHDASGAVVISELHIYFPRGEAIPSGGIGANTLREIHIGEVIRRWHETPESFLNSQAFKLSPEDEDDLLHVLRNYPSNTGRGGTPPIFLAALAFFYSQTLRKNPKSPNIELARLIGTPIRTVNTRVAKARQEGFLSTGVQTTVGGRARGLLTETAKQTITDYFERSDSEHK